MCQGLWLFMLEQIVFMRQYIRNGHTAMQVCTTGISCNIRGVYISNGNHYNNII